MMGVYSKLLEIQQALKAPKGQRNDFGKYNYRSCEDIVEAVKPLLGEQKAVLTISDEIKMIGERYYIFATAATAEYLGARKGLGIWLQAAYNSFRTPLIFSATLVIIAITGVLVCLVNLSERVLLGPADADADPDADQ